MSQCQRVLERFPSVNIYCMSPKGIALTLWQLISMNYGGISRHRCFSRNAYVVSATEAGRSLALLHWSVSRGTLRRKSGTILDVHHPRESMEVSEKQMVAPGKRKKYITI